MPHTESEPFAKEIKRKLSTTIFEKVLPPIKLETRAGVTLEFAKNTESKSNDFRENAILYYSALRTSENTEDRLNAMLGLVQQLINLGRYGQAKRLLSPAYTSYVSSLNIDPRLGVYHSARILEKLGWIADNEGNFEESEKYFTEVVQKIEVTSDAFRTSEENNLHSTAVHFLGRSKYGQGDYFTASQFFQIHLENKELNQAEQGFSHGWLSKCYMAMNDLDSAASEAELARESFEKFLKDHPEQGAMATYFLLRGELFFRKGEFENSRDYFNLVLETRYLKGRYPKGEAQALLGIAATYWAEKKIGAALVYGLRSLKTYPLLALQTQ